MSIDAVDVRIIEALQADGTLTQAALAERVVSTPSTCLRRVRALRKSGLLKQNVYLVEPAHLGRSITAIVTVRTKDHKSAVRKKLAACVNTEPSIVFAHEVTGDVDVILMCHFRDMQEYQDLCDRMVDQVEDIVRLSTHFVSATFKATTAVPTDVLNQATMSTGTTR